MNSLLQMLIDGNQFIVLIQGVLAFYWALAALGSLLLFSRIPLPSPIARALHLAAARGKTYPKPSTNKKLPFLLDFEAWSVPQGWFLHFYLIATLTNLALLAPIALTPSQFLRNKFVLPLVLFSVHCLRRLYESAFLLHYTPKARMHLLAYLVGVSYYVCTPLTLVLPILPALLSCAMGPLGLASLAPLKCSLAPADLFSGAVEGAQDYSLSSPVYLGMAIFFVANLEQNESHRILAALGRPQKDGEIRYAVPRGSWFELVAAPHYFFEVVVYVGLFAFQGLFPSTPSPSPSTLGAVVHRLMEDPRPLIFTWLFANLGYAAQETHRWYRDKFKSDYPPTRKAFIPYVL